MRVAASGEALLAPSITKRLIEEFAKHRAPVRAGGTELNTLTDREQEVIRLLARGLSNPEIARELKVGEATVKTFKRTRGQVWLMPHNPAFDPIPGNDAAVLGKVVTVIRKI